MKKILFFALLALGVNAKAQITLVHTYDSASTAGVGNFKDDQLMIINFEASGFRYIKVCRTGQYICIYNMNHSFLKKILWTGFPGASENNNEFIYFSEHLFNNDDKIEFMYTWKNGLIPNTDIYNEDGILIFSDTGAAYIRANYEQQQMPIYNTPVGTEMILSYRNGQAKVFSLPGTLSSSIAEANMQLVQMQSGQISNLYPNPSNGQVTLQYELPKGEQQGELVLYNMQGKEVKRYKIDNTFKDILLDNTQLPAGTYFYQLQTSKGAVGTKKMVIVN